MNRVARTAAVLIAVQLVIRAVLAFGGYFYWDDLIIVGRAGTNVVAFSPGQTRAASVVVGLSKDTWGAVILVNRSAGGLEAIVDVSGYFD